MKLSTLPLYTDKSKNHILKYGGKIGSLEFLRSVDKELGEEMLPRGILRPGEDDWKKATEPVKGLGKYGWIIRASHPNDFYGLVDVLETIIVRNYNDIPNAILKIRNSARRPDVIKYAHTENPSYDGNVFIGIEPYIDPNVFSNVKGSITEHPNRPGVYIISEEFLSYDGTWYNDSRNGFYNQNGELISSDYGEQRGIDTRMIKIYEKIKKLGLVVDSHSFQVEYGPGIKGRHVPWQIRGFKEKEIANFKLDVGYPIYKHVIGITNETGLLLKIILETGEYNSASIQEPHALLRTLHNQRMPFSMTLEHTQAYIATQLFGSLSKFSMAHNQFDPMMKSQVSLVGIDPYLPDSINKITGEEIMPTGGGYNHEITRSGDIGVRARIISDGTNAICEFE